MCIVPNRKFTLVMFSKTANFPKYDLHTVYVGYCGLG